MQVKGNQQGLGRPLKIIAALSPPHVTSRRLQPLALLAKCASRKGRGSVFEKFAGPFPYDRKRAGRVPETCLDLGRSGPGLDFRMFKKSQ